MASPDPRITTPFNANSTADDVLAGVDLTGKRAVVMGASSGLGVETAHALASAGAEVTLAVRDVEAGKRIAADITAKAGNKSVFVAPLDLNSYASITAFMKAWRGPLHMLVNNAGIATLPELTRTPKGLEQQFATNHLGHFQLTFGLHDALTTTGNVRIVSMSSRGHRMSPVVFDDIYFENRSYNDFVAYGQLKTANVLFAMEASKRSAKDSITANTCNPGKIRTNLMRHMRTSPEMQKHLEAMDWGTVDRGASTQVMLAASPLVEGNRGRYFENNNEAEIVPGLGIQSPAYGVRPYTIDAANAACLWDASLQMLKQRTAI